MLYDTIKNFTPAGKQAVSMLKQLHNASKANSYMGLDRPLRLQEVVAPRNSRQLKHEDVRLSALHAGCLNPPPPPVISPVEAKLALGP